MKQPTTQLLAAASSATVLLALVVGCQPRGDEGTVAELTTPEGTASPAMAGAAVRPTVDMEAVKQMVIEISTEIGDRVAGTEKLKDTARYVEAQLSQVGYNPEVTAYELPNGETGYNVVAATSADGPRLVLASHMDTVPDCPCANDDATGMAVMLEIARLLDAEGLSTSVPVQFAFLGAEEALEAHEAHGYSAVKFFEQLPEDDADRIAAAIWLDKLGRGPRFLAIYINGTSDAAANMFLEATEGAEPQPEIVDAKRWSEEMAFEDREIPTVWVEWGKDPDLHQPTDVADTVDWDKVETVAEATLNLVLRRAWVSAG